VAARNFRGTIRQESVAPSATGGRTSASRTWSRDRREEFNCRSSIADTVDYNFKASSSGLNAVPTLLTADSQQQRKHLAADDYSIASAKVHTVTWKPCPGWLKSLTLS
jgi:hypothetical protein